jgi:hypothetical protein
MPTDLVFQDNRRLDQEARLVVDLEDRAAVPLEADREDVLAAAALHAGAPVRGLCRVAKRPVGRALLGREPGGLPRPGSRENLKKPAGWPRRFRFPWCVRGSQPRTYLEGGTAVQRTERHPTPKALPAAAALAALLIIAAPAAPPARAADFIRGDTNASGARDLSDGIALFNFLFVGGAEPPCADAADADDSGGLDLTDGIFLLNFLFSGGSPPPPPLDGCGPDPTADGLDCAASEPCGPGGGNDVEGALNDLGVDTRPTPRLGPDREDLPESYSPFGATVGLGGGGSAGTLNVTDELFLAGIELPGRTGSIHVIEQLEAHVAPPATVEFGRTEVLHSLDGAANAWVAPSGREPNAQNYDPRTLRAAAAGDLDGDGFDEVAVVFFDRSENVFLKVIDDKEAGFAETVVAIATRRPDVQDLDLACGDFDGDGAGELAVAVGETLSADVLFLGGAAASYQPDRSLTKSFPREGADALITLTLAAGNIDYDNAEELVVVKNESTDAHPPVGSSRYYIHDDRSTGFERLETGPVGGMVPNFVGAVVADVSLGDIDGDGLDEIVFAGLAEFLGQSCDAVRGILVALDDREHLDPNDEFTRMAAAPASVRYGCSDVSSLRIRYLHVNCGDFDGDGRAEIQAGQDVYEDFAEKPPFTRIHEIPDDDFNDQDDQGGSYGEHTSVMLAADVTGDGRDDIINFTQWVRVPGDNFHGQITVWGISEVAQVGFKQLSRIVTESYFKGDNTEPIIVAANVDKDTPVLRYSEGEYRLVFTEPLVIAAVAGPPCHRDPAVGQNLSDCITSYGTATSATISREQVITVTASVSAGFSFEDRLFTQSAVEFKVTVTGAASRIDTSAYSLTKEIVHTSGPLEDIVVFTTVPVDQYTYEVLSHPDPALIGEKVVINIPRSPITLAAERGFYNRSVPDGSLKIDESVFDHTPGMVASYPDQAAKEALLRRHGGDPSLQVGPQSVDASGGSNTQSLIVSNEYGVGGSLELSFEVSLETTVAGIDIGGSVGAGFGHTFMVTNGNTTSYIGSVGAIPPESFLPANVYQWGMFTYVQADPASGRQFEVINYWVE